MDLRQRLRTGPPLVLDGPTGTELMRRGYETRLPLWSAGANAEALPLLQEIHADYVAAGAEVLTANTFRTNPTTLHKVGREADAPDLVAAAVAAARRAADAADHSVWVAGSLAPIEDCYSPLLVPADDELPEEHAAHARLMVDAGVDLLLVETMNTVREAVAATRAAKATGLPVWTSLVLGSDGNLLDGTPLSLAIAAVGALQPDALLVNCCALEAATRAAPMLTAAWPGPWGAYANVGTADPVVGWEQGRDVSDAEYANAAAGWLDTGARIVGSCCGTTPATTRALAQLFDARNL